MGIKERIQNTILFGIYSDIRKSLTFGLSSLKLRYRFLKKGSRMQRPLSLSGIDCIEIGRKVGVRKNARIECYKKFSGQTLSPKLIIGDRVNIMNNFCALVADEIRIGQNCVIASGVSLVSENHGMEIETDIPFQSQPLSHAPIVIGEGCWLGQNVIVLPGVKIGDKSIIGAGSIVNRDIPPYSMAVGSPAKVIKRYDFESHKWMRVKSVE